MITRYLILLPFTIVLAGCGDPRDTKIPSVEQLDSIQSQVSKLDDEERKLLKAYLERNLLFVSPVQAKINTLEGVTIRQAIEDQKEWYASQAAIAASQKAKLAEKIKAEESRNHALTETVTVRLVNRRVNTEDGVKPTNPNSTALAMLEFQFEVRNNTDEVISGIDGAADVKDMFGNWIKAFHISHQEPLNPAQSTMVTVREAVALSGNRVLFVGKIADTPIENLKVEWRPSTIVFSDGTTLSQSSK